jgi:hypothetical protein
VDVRCADGLACAAGVCVTPTPVGGPCSAESHACAPGSVCNALQGRCEAIVWIAEGGSCGTAFCAEGACDYDAGGRCPVFVPDGQRCNAADPSRPCRPYAACIDGLCRLPDANACR